MKTFFALILFFFTQNLLAQTQVLQGKITQQASKNFDDKLDFSLVLPALSQKEIYDFDLSYVMSPLTDVIRAVGQKIEVPSNLVLPSQKERFFFTIKLKKESFRLPLKTQSAQLGALQGQIPFRQTIDAIRAGAPLFSLINSFTLSSFSLAKITQEKMEIKAGENKLEETISVEDSSLVDKDYIKLGVNTTLIDGSYFPVDLKLMDSKKELKNYGENTFFSIAVPKDIFNSNTMKGDRGFNFSVVWNKTLVEKRIPILSDFVKVSNGQIFVDKEEINSNFNVLGYQIKAKGSNGEALYTKNYYGELPEFVDFPLSDDFDKIQFKVFAGEDNSPVFVYDDFDTLIMNSTYLSHYEEKL